MVLESSLSLGASIKVELEVILLAANARNVKKELFAFHGTICVLFETVVWDN